MRLTDADKLAERVANLEAVALEKTLKYSEEYEEWRVWSAILNERTAFKFDLYDAPTVDAVPVVRCKDCKYYINSNEKCELVDTRLHFYETDKVWTEDSFCSWGERREDAKIR